MNLLLTLTLLLTAPWAQAQDTHLVLTTDPFRMPELAAMPEVEVPEDVPEAPAEPEEMPELRGILRSPRATLVNLNGELIAVGGRFERFTVVAVGERNAVLLDGDEQHVVSIDDGRQHTEGQQAQGRQTQGKSNANRYR